MLKVSDGKSRPCTLCERSLNGSPIVGRMCRGGREALRVACANCGLVQHHVLPTEEELQRYYEESYRKEHGELPMVYNDRMIRPDHPEYGQALEARALGRAQLIVEQAFRMRSDEERKAVCAEPPFVLEMGAGDGSVSAAVATMTGALVWAVEPDPSVRGKVEHANVRHFASLDEVDDALIEGTKFDAIFTLHCVEHLPDPANVLAHLGSMAKIAAPIYVEVPNVEVPYGDLEGWFFQWPHLYDFSPATLAALMSRAGWGNPQFMAVGGGKAATALACAARWTGTPWQTSPDFATTAAGCVMGTAVTKALQAYDLDHKTMLVLREVMAQPAEKGSREWLLQRGIQQAIGQGQRAVAVLDSLQGYFHEMIKRTDEHMDEADKEARKQEWHKGFDAGAGARDMAWSQAVGHALNMIKANSVVGGGA